MPRRTSSAFSAPTFGYLRRLTPRSALRKAGVMSRRFWLRSELSNRR